MKENKLKDALRLRDAYILFMENIRKSDLIGDIEVYNGADKYKNFYRGVEYMECIEYPFSKNKMEVVFICKSNFEYSEILLINIDKKELEDQIKELLKDYKDLIK